MSEDAAPRFDILRVLRGTGQTLRRQRQGLILAGVLGAFLPALITALAIEALGMALAGVLNAPGGGVSAQWWAWWAIRLVLWVAEGVVAMTPIIWLTLCDQRGRRPSVSGALGSLARAFWPLLAIECLFDVRDWGAPLQLLFPATLAWLLTDVLLRLALLLLTAWFGVAAAVVVEEQVGAGRALARSARLLKGRRLIMAGLTSALLMATGALWKPVTALVDLLGVSDGLGHLVLATLLFQIPWVIAVVFQTMLYVEMRRLRDPFPEPAA